jgi:hydroxyethylthiazole kinase-like uncharacterized protein yjeF
VKVETIGPRVLAQLPLPAYGDEASKSDRGKLLIVAGSPRLPGAAMLAALAALRVGCGTVRLAAPASIALHLGVAAPELMVLPLPESGGRLDAAGALREVEAQYPACQALVIGPGLQPSGECDELVRGVVSRAPLPAVVDAQALLDWCTCDAGRAGRFEPGAGPRIFTPHPGELSEILGRPADALRTDAATVAREFACDRGCTLVMKDFQTLIASGEGPIYRNTAGSRALGTAGSGDSLAGMIGGLLAQGLEPMAAAVQGVHLHALCGERAASEIGEDGILARELIDRLPSVLRRLRQISGARTLRRGRASSDRRSRPLRTE